MDLISSILRFILAILFGAVIGFERDRHGRAAGLRTNMLVCSGAALFTMISVTVVNGHGDPSRIAAQIVSGIGFLGAGTILKSGFSVRGLTTAACMWVVAAVGIATGAGMYELAGAATLITLITMFTAKSIENRVRRLSSLKLTTMSRSMETVMEIKKICESHRSITISSLHTEYDEGKQMHTTTFFLEAMSSNLKEKDITLNLAQTLEKIEPKISSYRLEFLN